MPANPKDPDPDTITDTITSKAAAPQGRKTEYNPSTAANICEQIALGKTLNQIAEQPDMPALATIMNWLHGYTQETAVQTDFIERYSRARKSQIDTWVNDGYTRVMTADVSHSNLVRVQLDWIKWVASKIIPKVYGDLQQVDISGGIELSIAPVAKISHKTTGQIEARDAQDER